jgi:nondiscriminating glutamyl-tRNA synthetase
MAPSPTGWAHLGSARTALFNLLYARHHGGTFVLRLDDTDLERNRPEYEQGIYDSFRWLGMTWDEGADVGGPYGPYKESELLDAYREEAAKLIASGAAYRCYCTAEELAAEREAARAAGRQSYKYSRRCLTNPPAGRTEFVVRFRVPQGETAFTDLVRGEIRFDNEELGDPVIVKSNGWPTYNFASPIDDVRMGITHVFRSEEHVPNTPLQLMFWDAMGAARPLLGHFPVVLGKDGKKLSKRLHPEARLDLFREEGYLPEALLNYLALLGWNPGTEQEIFSLDELVRAFDVDRVQRAGAQFDREKLDWMNGQYIRALSDAELAGRLRPYLPDLPESMLEPAATALKDRMKRLDEAGPYLGYLKQAPPPLTLKDGQREMLEAAVKGLEDVEWTAPEIESALEAVREAGAWSKGKFLTPIRESVAGKVAPPIQHTLSLLSKPEALARMRRVLT